MAASMKVALPNGQEWAVGSYTSISPAEIIIPFDGMEGMSDAEIGAAVRSLIHEAHYVRATVEADNILLSNRHHEQWDKELNISEVKTLLSGFAGHSPNIRAALDLLIRHEQHEQERAEKKRRTKELRQSIAASYDSLFVLLGRRDGFHCALCRSTDKLVIDHITALANNGTNDLSNLQLLCAPCNSRKGAR